MKLSHLNGLRALEATLRRGTFTAAADELGVTTAAIGQQIRGLEDYLNVKLFDRLPTGARPTTLALAAATRLTVGFTQIEEAFQELGSNRNTSTLKLTMSHFILDDWLADRMSRFHKLLPGVAVSYHTGEEIVDLRTTDIDMAVRFSEEPGPEYAFDPLYNGCFMPLCTPGFAAKHDLRPTTSDLTGVPLFQFHDNTADPSWVGWPELLRRHHVDRSGTGPVQHVSGYRVALSGEGLVLCGLTESFNDLRDGRLVAPLGPRFVTQFSFGFRLVWPAGRTLTRPMRHFRRWMQEECAAFLEEASRLVGVPLGKPPACGRA